MSYVQAGLVTDEELNIKADAAMPPPPSDVDLTAVFDFMARLGLEAKNALEHPEVRAFMRKTQVKAEEVKAEIRRREQKKSLLVWGLAAAGIGFLVIRRKR